MIRGMDFDRRSPSASLDGSDSASNRLSPNSVVIQLPSVAGQPRRCATSSSIEKRSIRSNCSDSLDMTPNCDFNPSIISRRRQTYTPGVSPKPNQAPKVISVRRVSNASTASPPLVPKPKVTTTTTNTKANVPRHSIIANMGGRKSRLPRNIPRDSTRTGKRGLTHGTFSRKAKKSKWETGIEAIDELLDPRCKAYRHMTPTQKKSLSDVKKLLILGSTPQGAKMQHVPTDLILMSEHGGGLMKKDTNVKAGMDDSDTVASSVDSFASGEEDDDISILSFHTQASTYHILEEYAGVKNSASALESVIEDAVPMSPKLKSKPALRIPRIARNNIPKIPKTISMDHSTATSPTASLSLSFESNDQLQQLLPSLTFPAPQMSLKEQIEMHFVPPEFTKMSKKQQVALYNMLQWDNIHKWNFDIFELEELTRGKPMLFMGWAILGAPYSQQAMAKELGKDFLQVSEGYHFLNDLKIPPKKLYNYIKVIEQDYNSKNAYHNATHGADVLQSLHGLIQMSGMSGSQYFMKNCSKIQIFSILLSALVHDVAHFGTTNAYHTKLQTELAIMYNDKSVMENWHVAHAFARMFDLDMSLACNMDAKNVVFSKFQQSNKRSKCNLLCNATPEQFNDIRKMMIDAVLHTDMSSHFAMVNRMRGMLMQKEENINTSSNPEEDSWQVLMYMLHMADISGQAKEDHLSRGWTNRCFDEFFAQGDQEVSLGVPISPNCDRNEVVIPESQVGFIKFVVQPAFEVLGKYIPSVEERVLPIIEDNRTCYSVYVEQQ